MSSQITTPKGPNMEMAATASTTKAIPTIIALIVALRESLFGHLSRLRGLVHQWLGQSALDRPSVPKSFIQGRFFESNQLGPFDTGARFAVKRESVIRADVSGLFFRRGPSAVVWRVMAAAVNSIKRVYGAWLAPHVRQEVFKVIPSFTDGDAAPAVAKVVGGSRIQASGAHGLPCAVLGGVR
ncbi:MAG: hypothetical protein RLY20_3167 [Verrucomicrobiota bacterium]